jgi:hypothetical protein
METSPQDEERRSDTPAQALPQAVSLPPLSSLVGDNPKEKRKFGIHTELEDEEEEIKALHQNQHKKQATPRDDGLPQSAPRPRQSFII